MTDPPERINQELQSTSRMVRENQQAIKYKGGLIVAWFVLTMTLILIGIPLVLSIGGPIVAVGFMWVVLIQGVSPDEIPDRMFNFER